MNIIFIIAVTLFIDTSWAQTISKSPTCYSNGDTLTLVCHTANFTEAINFLLNAVNKGGCAPSFGCATGILQSGTTTTRLTISSFSDTVHGGHWTCSYGSLGSSPLNIAANPCLQLYSKSYEEGGPSFGSQGGLSAVTGWCYFMITKYCKCIQFTFLVAQQLYFSTRYVINGRVFYGIEFVIIAAITQVLCTVPIWVLLGLYAVLIYLIILPLLITVWSSVAVMVYLLLKAFFCQKEWTYTEFKDELMHRSLSDDYGIKFNTINKDKIWFKVWARDDVLMTLHGYEKRPFLNIIIGYGDRPRKVISDSKSSIPIVDCNDVLSTTEDKYRIFYLTCKEHYVTVVRVLNGEEEIVLKWSNTKSSKPLDISDIVISNYMRDLKDLEVTERQTQTRAEWIFFIRQDDRLYEDEDDSPKTVTLVLVVLLPIAWIVLPILFLKKCIIPKGPLEMAYHKASRSVELHWKAPQMYCVKRYEIEKSYNGSQIWTSAGSSNEPRFTDANIPQNQQRACYRVKTRFTCFVSKPLEAKESIVYENSEELNQSIEYTENSDGNQDVATIRWARSTEENVIGYRIETKQTEQADWNVVIPDRATTLRFGNRDITNQEYTHSDLRSALEVSVRTRFRDGVGNRIIRRRDSLN